MSLRLFADHCVPGSVIQILMASHHTVFRLRDHIPHDSLDSIVIAKAQDLDAVLISLNGDFSDIVAYPPARFKGIIAIQVKNHPEIIPQLVQRLTNYASVHGDMAHYVGKLLLVEPHRIRSRS